MFKPIIVVWDTSEARDDSLRAGLAERTLGATDLPSGPTITVGVTERDGRGTSILGGLWTKLGFRR